MGGKRQFLFASAEDCLAQDKAFSCKLPATFKSDAAIVGKGVGPTWSLLEKKLMVSRS